MQEDIFVEKLETDPTYRDGSITSPRDPDISRPHSQPVSNMYIPKKLRVAQLTKMEAFGLKTSLGLSKPLHGSIDEAPTGSSQRRVSTPSMLRRGLSRRPSTALELGSAGRSEGAIAGTRLRRSPTRSISPPHPVSRSQVTGPGDRAGTALIPAHASSTYPLMSSDQPLNMSPRTRVERDRVWEQARIEAWKGAEPSNTLSRTLRLGAPYSPPRGERQSCSREKVLSGGPQTVPSSEPQARLDQMRAEGVTVSQEVAEANRRTHAKVDYIRMQHE